MFLHHVGHHANRFGDVVQMILSILRLVSLTSRCMLFIMFICAECEQVMHMFDAMWLLHMLHISSHTFLYSSTSHRIIQHVDSGEFEVDQTHHPFSIPAYCLLLQFTGYVQYCIIYAGLTAIDECDDKTDKIIWLLLISNLALIYCMLYEADYNASYATLTRIAVTCYKNGMWRTSCVVMTQNKII